MNFDEEEKKKNVTLKKLKRFLPLKCLWEKWEREKKIWVS